MRPRRCIDGLFFKVYLNAETEGVAVSGMRLCIRSLDGGGRGSAEMGYFVLMKVDIGGKVESRSVTTIHHVPQSWLW